MRILYGACGAGMGHAMRAGVVVEHLRARGHNVICCASSQPAVEYLSRHAPTFYVPGISARMTGHRVALLPTIADNAWRMVFDGAASNHAASVASGFRPEAVVSDYDPWSARWATSTHVRLVAVDNIHFLGRCQHPKAWIDAEPLAIATIVASALVVPRADRYLVTSFVEAPVSAPRTSLQLPILRPSILAARASAHRSGPVLVYFNAKSDHAHIARVLAGLPYFFRLYGDSSVRAPVLAGNVERMPFSEEGIAADLAAASAVIGGAGFTLMTEAIYLGKPMLAVPFGNQFEQILNADYLQALGWGERCDVLEPGAAARFLARSDEYAARVAGFQHDGNVGLYAAVDAALEAA